MGFFEAFFIGMAQGLTEFLPVSSSGHLALIESFFNLTSESLLFEVGVHIGTVLSIIVVYRKTILNLSKDSLKFMTNFKVNDGSYLFSLIVVSAIPAGLIGIFFKDLITEAFSSLLVVGICFLVTGFVLFWTEKKIAGTSEDELGEFGKLSDAREITYKQAFLVGLAQAVAMLPGISRSGATIASGLYLGVPRSTAAMFSFLMSIPVILGAGLLQLKALNGLNYLELQHLLFSVLISFIFGLVGLLLILYFVKKAKLSTFSWYLWVLGTCSIIYYFIGR